jgi:putative thioredoxin
METQAAAVIDVGVENFQKEVVDRSRTLPVLIDFWATWCGPCKTLGPVLEKLAREMPGKFVLAKIDIDKSPEIADLFQIQSVPTVMLLKGARPVDGFMGRGCRRRNVRTFLEQHLGVAARAHCRRRRSSSRGTARAGGRDPAHAPADQTRRRPRRA